MSSHGPNKRRPLPPPPAHFRLHAPLAPPPAPEPAVEEAFQPPRPEQPAAAKAAGDGPCEKPTDPPGEAAAKIDKNASTPVVEGAPQAAAAEGTTPHEESDHDSIAGEINPPKHGDEGAPAEESQEQAKVVEAAVVELLDVKEGETQASAAAQPDAVPSAPPVPATAAPTASAGPAKAVDLSFLDDSDDDEEDTSKRSFPTTADKAPRSTAAAAAYAKRRHALEQKDGGGDLSGGESGKVGDGMFMSKGHAKTKKTSPKSHVKVKHTPKVPRDSPRKKRAAGGLKSPPEDIVPRRTSARRSLPSAKAAASEEGQLKSPPEDILALASPLSRRRGKRDKTSHAQTVDETPSAPCPEVAEGWTKKEVPRKRGSGVDRYYFSPEGRRFRSLAEVRRFLEKASMEFAKEGEEGGEAAMEAEPDATEAEPDAQETDDKPAAIEGTARRSKRKRDASDGAAEPTPDDVESGGGGTRRSTRERKPSLQAAEGRSNRSAAAALQAVAKSGKKPASKKAAAKKPAAARKPPAMKAAAAEVAVGVARGSLPPLPLAVGDRVEAKYRGKGRRYYPGTIVGIVPPGDKYDVDYDDGDKDLGLSVHFIRRLEGAYELMEVEVPDEENEVEAEEMEAEDEYEEEEEEEESDYEDKKPKAKRARTKKSPAKSPRTTAYLEAKKSKTWTERIAMLKAHKAEHGTCDLTPWKKTVDSRLFSFVIESRKQYKRYVRGKASSMNAARIADLEKLGFDFCPIESGKMKSNHEMRFQQQWDEQYAALIKYKAEHGDCLVSCAEKGKSAEHKKLANWVRGQRKHLNKVGREGFNADRMAKLEAIGFDFDPVSSGAYISKKRKNMFARVDGNWEKNYQNLVKFQKEHGNIIVGPKSEGYAGLYNWIHCQRKEYKKFEAGDEKALMYPEWVAKLNEVGFDFAPMKGDGFSKMLLERQGKVFGKQWMQRYEELKEFQKKNGHCYVVRSKRGKDNAVLASWIHVQRKYKHDHDLGKRTPLTAERIQLLDDIGLDWAPSASGATYKIRQESRDEDWEAVFQKLCAYKEKSGHANPKKKEKILGTWACRMRKLYAQNQEGKTTTLTETKIAKLQSIGFNFQKREWTSMKTEETVSQTETV